MGPSTLRLAAELRERTGGLFYASESEAPFEVFALEDEGEGDLMAEGLLLALDMIAPVDFGDFVLTLSDIPGMSRSGHHPDAIRRYRTLVESFRSSLATIQVYRINPTKPPNDELSFHLLVGSTADGDWIGISPSFRLDPTNRRSERRPVEVPPPKESTLALTQELEAKLVSAGGCRWPSSFAPNYFDFNPDPGPEFLIECGGSRRLIVSQLLEALSLVKQCTFTGFEENSDADEEAGFPPERRQGLASLDDFLTRNLSDLREYVIDYIRTGDFFLYDIGRTEDGDWLGVSTLAVWT